MSEKKNLFSIIVPCYNQEEYLEDCLNSVKNQTFLDWECIIVNDGSTDQSEKIALSFVNMDHRFIYKTKTNSGLASTRNYGINLSNGDYILPLDGDDMIGENYLLKAFKIFSEKPLTKIVYCKAALFGNENKKWKLENYSYRRILFNNSIFCSAIYKKSDFLKTDGYDINMIYGYEDWELWIQLLNPDDKVERIKSIEFFYRKRLGSMISFVKNKNDLKKMTEYIFNKHKSKYVEILNLENSIAGFEKFIYTQDKLNEIKNSFSYKVFYKIEKEIGRFFNRLK